MTTTKTIKAAEVQEGHAVTRIVAQYKRRFRPGTYPMDFGITKSKGQWPTVVDTRFLEDGEGGQPTVYLVLSDDPNGTYCLYPDDDVTVEVSS